MSADPEARVGAVRPPTTWSPVGTHDAACRICGTPGPHPLLRAREMLLGTRETFSYFRCRCCGCVQITVIPADLARHYPPGYFSFRPQHRLAHSRMRAFADRHRVRDALHGNDPLGRIVNRVCKPLDYVTWARIAGVDTRARVLDVGAGSGRLAVLMSLGGFTRVQGVDPFIAETLRYPRDVTIHREDPIHFAGTHPGAFDLVMAHHAFEHHPDPHALMTALATLLAPGGCVLIRIPVADSTAFERYGPHWVQLDPPRHLHLHTRRSLEQLAQRAGLHIERVVHDANPSQFSGSELLRRDIPLSAPRKTKDVFDRAERARFRAETDEANRDGRGDQAAFYLRGS